MESAFRQAQPDLHSLTGVQWSAGIAMVIGAVVLLATQHAIAGPALRRTTTDDKSV